MRPHFAFCVLASAAILQAQDLPTPLFTRADPQVVYPGSPGWLDGNGRVVVYLQGENLAPDDDMGHPSGPASGYQHVFVRGVSPSGAFSPWVRCEASNGCATYGGAARSVLILAADPAHFLSEPGSHLQVKMWVSLGPDGANDPSGATTQHSGWSAVKTLDVAPPGVTKPVPVAISEAPTIARLAPSNFSVMDPAASYRIRLYGQHLCGDGYRIVFNGDEAGAVPPEGHCIGIDDDGSALKGDEALLRVTIPEKYRRTSPGQLSVVIVRDRERSGSRVITFSAPTVLAKATSHAVPAPLEPRTTVPTTAELRPNLPPTITRLLPASLRIGDRATPARIRIYGQRLGHGPLKVAFDGNLAAAIPAEDLPKNVDDDGSALPNGESVFHVTLPERLRRTAPGSLQLTVLSGEARVGTLVLAFESAPLIADPRIKVTPQIPVPPPIKPTHR